MAPDTPEEETYLKTLAGRLKLSPELVAEIHKSAAADPAAGARQNAALGARASSH